MACYFGGLAIDGFLQRKAEGKIPPHSWARTADQQTRDDVAATVVAAFNLARDSAPHQRNEALREATFYVPYELARLNADAPDFRLEDLGPMVHGKEWCDKVGEVIAPSVDYRLETRVFLYFPNGATQATAVFVSVNIELKYPMKGLERPEVGDAIRHTVRAAVEANLCQVGVWRAQNGVWLRGNPAIMGRIGDTEPLPVIFNFREKAFGAMYYPLAGVVWFVTMGVMPLITTHLDREFLPK